MITRCDIKSAFKDFKPMIKPYKLMKRANFCHKWIFSFFYFVVGCLNSVMIQFAINLLICNVYFVVLGVIGFVC